jgi:hypothetical protein
MLPLPRFRVGKLVYWSKNRKKSTFYRSGKESIFTPLECAQSSPSHRKTSTITFFTFIFTLTFFTLLFLRFLFEFFLNNCILMPRQVSILHKSEKLKCNFWEKIQLKNVKKVRVKKVSVKINVKKVIVPKNGVNDTFPLKSEKNFGSRPFICDRYWKLVPNFLILSQFKNKVIKMQNKRRLTLL